MFTHALGAKLSKSKNALICLVLERAEKLNNFGSSEATFQTLNGATPGLQAIFKFEKIYPGEEFLVLENPLREKFTIPCQYIYPWHCSNLAVIDKVI